jgi:hypothetical protein
LMALYRQELRVAANAAPPRAALMTAGYCHEDPKIAGRRGTELIAWCLEQQRERARLGPVVN